MKPHNLWIFSAMPDAGSYAFHATSPVNSWCGRIYKNLMPTLINLSLRNFLSIAFDAHDSWYGVGGGSAAYTAFFDTASWVAHFSGLKDIDLFSRAEWELSRMRLHRNGVESSYQICSAHPLKFFI